MAAITLELHDKIISYHRMLNDRKPLFLTSRKISREDAPEAMQNLAGGEFFSVGASSRPEVAAITVFTILHEIGQKISNLRHRISPRS